MKLTYILPLAASLIAGNLIAQKVTHRATRHTTAAPAAVTTFTPAGKAFIQDAINSNNEAMALAQMAVRQSKSPAVQQIAGQFLNDHRAAQQKLYALAGLQNPIPYNNYGSQASGTTKLPLTDNLSNRRNNTVVSISGNSNTNPPVVAATTTGSNTANSGNNTANNNAYRNDTSSRFGVNQTFNGNTGIDNANGVNNSNRTDIGSYSGRWTENTTVIDNQPVTVAAQPATSGNYPASATTPGYNAPAINSTDNTPNFPARTTDTVRQTGSSLGFQNTGTNLSFPGNDRYSRTTPPTSTNSSAGGDYGYNGIVVNNAPTNALNTAPYSNNDINGNVVQTGQLQGTSNPTAVINSSTTSMNNNQVGFNNSNTSRSNDVAIRAEANGSAVPATNYNTTNQPATAATPVRTDTTSGSPIIAARLGNRRTGAANSGTQNTAANNYNQAGSFYSTPSAATPAITALQNTQPDTFDRQWAIQMNTVEMAAAQKYQAALPKIRNTQLHNYINTTLPLLQGHQFALKQWQVKQ